MCWSQHPHTLRASRVCGAIRVEVLQFEEKGQLCAHSGAADKDRTANDKSILMNLLLAVASRTCSWDQQSGIGTERAFRHQLHHEVMTNFSIIFCLII